MNVFHGALTGTGTLHPGQTMLLEDLTNVYLVEDHGLIEAQIQPERKVLAVLFYSANDQLYALEPKQSRTIFLASGQPLGKDRRYLLRRGMEFYIEKEGQSFRLA